MEEFLNINDGVMSVPFTVIKNQEGEVTKIVGFDQAKFKKCLFIA